MAYILALVVGLGSVGLYMAAFFFPEVYRKNDFVLSGIGMFYALVLWVCAGRITGGVLLGQAASVTLLGWLAWQSLEMRRSLTPIDQQTRLPGSARTLADVLRQVAKDLPGQLQQQAKRLSLPAALGGLSQRATRAIGTTPQRAPRQLQDGDRVRQPTVKQPSPSTTSASPTKPTKSVKPDRPPAKKQRPVKPIEPSAPVDQSTADAIVSSPISPLPVTTPPGPTEPIAPEPPAAIEPPEAIAPPTADDLTLADLPAAPEAIAPGTLAESGPDAGLEAEPISASTPDADPELLTAPVTPPASDDDFGFDDDLTPTRTSAAELRELTAQSAASRRPSWFTTLKRRLQRSRNPNARSPQAESSPAQEGLTVETAPDPVLERAETALEANALQEPIQVPVDTAPLSAPQQTPELSDPNGAPVEPDAEPADSAPLIAMREEISEAIAPPIAAESLIPNVEEDWNLGWMETSVPSEVVPAPPAADLEDADFEEAEFLGSDPSVTITVEAETVPAVDAEPTADGLTDTEWDLDWAQEVVAADSAAEVVAELLAESPLDASPEPLPEPSLATLPDLSPEFAGASPPEQAVALPDSSPEFAEEAGADFTVEPEPDLDSSSGLDAAVSEAEWEDWEAPVTDELTEAAAPADEWEELVDEPPVFLPLLIEDVDVELEVDPIASESNWPESESNWPESESNWSDADPNWPEPESNWPESEPVTIAPAADVVQPPEAESDAIAFPSEDFSELLNTAESVGVESPDATVALDQLAAIAPLVDIGEPLPDSNESLSSANGFLSLTDESLSVIDEGSGLADESPRVIDEESSLTDESLSLVDESPRVIDEFLSVADESLSVADESSSLANEFPNIIYEGLLVIDESPLTIDESPAVLDESLSQELEPIASDFESETAFVESTDLLAATDRDLSDDAAAEVEIGVASEAVLDMPSELTSGASGSLPATPPTRSTRKLMIQVVKVEPSEAASEPLPDVEAPPSRE